MNPEDHLLTPRPPLLDENRREGNRAECSSPTLTAREQPIDQETEAALELCSGSRFG